MYAHIIKLALSSFQRYRNVHTYNVLRRYTVKNHFKKYITSDISHDYKHTYVVVTVVFSIKCKSTFL